MFEFWGLLSIHFTFEAHDHIFKEQSLRLQQVNVALLLQRCEEYRFSDVELEELHKECAIGFCDSIFFDVADDAVLCELLSWKSFVLKLSD